MTIEGLNLRRAPNLSASIIEKLSLHEEVLFLNEITDSTEQINLGEEVANEPWVKVNYQGKEGWVYGAGVHFYRKTRGE